MYIAQLIRRLLATMKSVMYGLDTQQTTNMDVSEKTSQSQNFTEKYYCECSYTVFRPDAQAAPSDLQRQLQLAVYFYW